MGSIKSRPYRVQWYDGATWRTCFRSHYATRAGAWRAVHRDSMMYGAELRVVRV